MADGKAIQKNFSEKEAVEKICELVPLEYKQLNIMTTQGDAEVKVSKKDKITVIDKLKKDNPKDVQVEKNNKAAGTRARKAALELTKLLKEFRKVSVEEAKK